MSNFLMLNKRKRSDFIRDFKHKKNSSTMDSGLPLLISKEEIFPNERK